VKPLKIYREAREELRDSIDWLKTKSRQLADGFYLEIEAAFLRIRRNPLAGERYKKTRFRFVIVRRFSYVIYYEDVGDTIWVSAVAHGSRRPGYWLRRKPPK
jgi:plasmid stabilization system protein ParE